MIEIILTVAGVVIGYNLKTVADGIVYMMNRAKIEEELRAVERQKFANRYKLYRQIRDRQFEMK